MYSKKIQIDQNLVESELKNLIKKQADIKEFKLSEIEIVSNENVYEKTLEEINNQINEFGLRPVQKSLVSHLLPQMVER